MRLGEAVWWDPSTPTGRVSWIPMHEDLAASLGGLEPPSTPEVVVALEPPLEVRVEIIEEPMIDVDVELIIAR